MPAFRGSNIRPQQVDESIPRNGARASLEMEVEQHRQMLLGPEANGADQRRRSKNVELKLSGHNVLRLG